MGLWDRWPDDLFSKDFTNVIAGIILLASIIIALSGSITTSVFYYLAISSFLVLTFNNFAPQKWKSFFGSRKKAYIAYIVGAGIGILLGIESTGASGLSFILPTQSGGPTLSLITLSLASFPTIDLTTLFVNYIAPLIEPLLWRGIVYPILLDIYEGKDHKGELKPKILAVFTCAYLFGFLHVAVYYESFASTLTSVQAFLNTAGQVSFAALFSIFFITGSSLAQSIAFETGWHFVNNLYSQAIPAGQIYPTIFVFSLILFIIAELVNKYLGGNGTQKAVTPKKS